MGTILKTNDLTKKYSGKVVVDNLNIEIKEGEIFGLLGPNGAGKSTTMNMICGIVRPTLGSVEFMEQDFQKNRKKLIENLGYIPQDLAIHGNLKAWENVELFTSLYGIKGTELKERIDESLEYVGLIDKRNDYAKTFSGGMKRRLNIACAIGHHPKLLIFDEPTVGIDPQSRNFILEKIKASNKNGATIIYTSHYMEEVEAICTKIAIMDNGKVIATGTSEELKKMVVDDTSSITVQQMKAKLRRVKNLGLVIIDYLQLMDSTSKSDNRVVIISEITRQLKVMAKELNVPVILLSQLSRAVESRTDKRPMLSDLRESGSIEQDADIVLFLYREAYYNKESQRPNISECIIAKNRHGETGTVELVWDGQFTRFSNLDKNPVPEG